MELGIFYRDSDSENENLSVQGKVTINLLTEQLLGTLQRTTWRNMFIRLPVHAIDCRG